MQHDDRFARAKQVPCESYLGSKGWSGRKHGAHHLVGPCPHCGAGDDRFFIDLKNNTWGMRQCTHGAPATVGGNVGGDTLELVKMVEQVGNADALDRLVGARPSGAAPESVKPNGYAGKRDLDWSKQTPFYYNDENGNVLFRQLRVPVIKADGTPLINKKGKQDKEFFRQVRRTNGRWGKPGNDSVRAVPYKLHELASAMLFGGGDGHVYVAEGEAKADVLRGWGLVATSILKDDGDFGKWFQGAKVVIVPDNDPAGAKYAERIANGLRTYAVSINLVMLPGLSPTEDVVDWVRAGGTSEVFRLLPREPFLQTAAQAPAQPGADADDDTWRDDCTRNTHGEMHSNLSNALIAVRAKFPDLVSYNLMLHAAVFRNGGAPVHDVDVLSMQEWMQRAGLMHIGKNTVADAMEVVAHQHAFHPIRDWLKGLTWDGVPRLDEFLPRYFGTISSVYERAIGKMFLVSMVARVMKPGEKVDHVLVIEGPQGIMKSSACKVLGDVYFSDNLPDVSNKDSSQHLRGKWLIEIAEMHAFTRAETAALKSFISRTEERYFARYSRLESFEPRQCAFIGTTNKDAYLRDETGGRRFWPVRAGIIDIEALKADRGQLFAEALVAYESGYDWWPDKQFELDHIKPQQDDRYEDDTWEVAVMEFLRTLVPGSYGLKHTTVYHVARGMGIETARIGTVEQRRISNLLTREGWMRGKQDGNGRVEWTK